MSIQIRDVIREMSPPWLAREWGEKLLYTIGLTLDGIIDWADQGLMSRFPYRETPDGAVPHIATNRLIVRGFAESKSAFLDRLKLWLEIDYHPTRGNAFALLTQIQGYLTGYAVRLRTVDVHGTWYSIYENGLR